MKPPSHEVTIQREYYRTTADRYDEMRRAEEESYDFAFAFLHSAISLLGVRSLLDVGSGTGNALVRAKASCPELKLVGIEPSAEMRRVGYSKGLREDQLVDGDAQQLAFGDGAFDLVCEFGALHHIPDPSLAVREMLRVASKAIFIADANNFGQGSLLARTAKQLLNAAGLWPVVDFVKTRGRGYSVSDGDGLSYSYSVFNDYKQIRRRCRTIHIVNLGPAGPDLYRSAAAVALLGIK